MWRLQNWRAKMSLWCGCMRISRTVRLWQPEHVCSSTLLHFMTQLSRHSLSSLGGAPFVWQVRFEIFFFFFWLCLGFGKSFWLCCNGSCWFLSGLDVWIFWGWSSSFGRCWWHVSEVSPLVAQIPFIDAFQVFFGSLAYGD